jgi:hypothetical protein
MLINSYRFVDPDVQAYIAAVEAADGQALETGVKDAINAFIVGCKSDGIWSAIKASCILAGARTLSGTLTPLTGAAPTNNNFVTSDYNRKTGLIGNATNKSLNSNTAHNVTSQNNAHVSVFSSQLPSAGRRAYIAAVSGSFTIMSQDADDVNTSTWYVHDTGSSVPRFLDSGTGFKGVSRSSTDSFVRRTGGANTTVTRTASATAPGSGNFFVFCRGDNSTAYSDARIAFYSIGNDVDLALLGTRVTTLINAIAAAIP